MLHKVKPILNLYFPVTFMCILIMSITIDDDDDAIFVLLQKKQSVDIPQFDCTEC